MGELMKSLIIAEKPSVAKDIAKVLKCSKKGEGYFYSDKYIISWAIGHLVGLCNPEEYDASLKKWSESTLPIIPEKIKIKPIKRTQPQLKILKSLMKLDEVENIVCATDSGREGELIFRYIYKIAKCKKPFKRLWISSMTNEAIELGFKNLKDGSEYDNLYFSAKCRSEADWLVGINASRAFTLKFGTLLSIGRVQTPTLAIIVNKHKEIEAFDIKDYFEIHAVFSKEDDGQIYNGIWIDESKNDTKILDKNIAKEICSAIKGRTGVVKSVDNEIKKQAPPLLYDLTELQRDCNKKYSYSAQKTLSIAQDLYEKRKLITYPRTDSRYLSNDMKKVLSPTLNKLNSLSEYNKFVSPLLENSLKITKRIIDDSKITDHHAIIPTITNINLSSLSSDEKNVYDLIARRFISVFYDFYVYNITKIITSIANHSFITKGTTIIDKGFTVLNIETKAKKKEEILPNVSKGDSVLLDSEKIVNKKTKPPSPYNEATLLSAMENAGRFIEDESLKELIKDSGLGTPATRASIIERLLEIGYIKRDKKNIIPTKKGIDLIHVAPPELISPETTGKWEKGLSSISKGNMQSDKFMNSINRYVHFLVNYAKNCNIDVQFENDNNKYGKNNNTNKNFKSYGKCIKCDGEILQNSKSFYCSNWKNGCNITFWKNSLKNYNIELDEKIITPLLKDGKVCDIKMTIDNGNKEITGDILIKNYALLVVQK